MPSLKQLDIVNLCTTHCNELSTFVSSSMQWVKWKCLYIYTYFFIFICFFLFGFCFKCASNLFEFIQWMIFIHSYTRILFIILDNYTLIHIDGVLAILFFFSDWTSTTSQSSLQMLFFWDEERLISSYFLLNVNDSIPFWNHHKNDLILFTIATN